jgi:hypothetical protein
MPSNEDILLAARSILSYLPELLGASAHLVSRPLEDLLSSARAGARVENQILDLLVREEKTRAWISNFLKKASAEGTYRVYGWLAHEHPEMVYAFVGTGQ